MKKTLFITLLAIVLTIGIVFNGFAQQKPERGGTLRCIRPMFPKVVGHPLEMSPTDSIFALMYSERLITWDKEGRVLPELAESWEGDPANKTFSFRLRKGIKFHDGTPFNAEAVRWNIQFRKDAGRQQDGDLIKSMEVIDEYTLKFHLTDYTSQAAVNFGWTQVYSPTAIEKNGLDWARTHGIGTGPFKFVDFKRDVHYICERNDNYWRPGYPYLDRIEVRYIPDVMTSTAMMQAEEADMWLDVTTIKNVIDLEKMGFKINWGPGMFWALFPNSKDANSIYANKKVREAIEYALDRPAIAKALGYGKYEPLHQMAPAGTKGYNPDYSPRPYNPAKAKQLLTEAGYPNGFKTEITCTESARDFAAAVQAYLAAVGIEARLDICDMGRYYGKFYATGWSDLLLGVTGIDADYLVGLFRHFGPRPMVNIISLKKSPEFLGLCNKALKTFDKEEEKALTKQIVRQGTEDAMVIPIYRSVNACVLQKYVHSEYIKIHTVINNSYEDWMEKH